MQRNTLKRKAMLAIVDNFTSRRSASHPVDALTITRTAFGNSPSADEVSASTELVDELTQKQLITLDTPDSYAPVTLGGDLYDGFGRLQFGLEWEFVGNISRGRADMTCGAIWPVRMGAPTFSDERFSVPVTEIRKGRFVFRGRVRGGAPCGEGVAHEIVQPGESMGFRRDGVFDSNWMRLDGKCVPYASSEVTLTLVQDGPMAGSYRYDGRNGISGNMSADDAAELWKKNATVSDSSALRMWSDIFQSNTAAENRELVANRTNIYAVSDDGKLLGGIATQCKTLQRRAILGICTNIQGIGIGTCLIDAKMAEVPRGQNRVLIAQAEKQARGFYTKLGFTTCVGDEASEDEFTIRLELHRDRWGQREPPPGVLLLMKTDCN